MRTALLFVALASLTATALSQVVPEAIYYRFNEGSGTSLTNVAVPGYGVPTGTINGALTFGAGQFSTGIVGTNLASASNFVTTNYNLASLAGVPWTIEFWFKQGGAPSLQYHVGQQSSSGFRIFCGSAGGNMVLSGTSFTTVTIPGVPAIGSSAHYAFVYDPGPNTITGYFNGVPQAPTTQAAVPAPTGTMILCGNATSNGTFGTLDEFRLWLRARTASEIALSYNTELSSNNILAAVTTGGGVGDLSIGLTAISPTATSGFLLLTTTPTTPMGTGPMIGISPDGLTWSIFSQPLFAGNPLHFPVGIPGVFPDQPFTVAPGTLSFLSGQVWEAVAVLLATGDTYAGGSNVQRLTW